GNRETCSGRHRFVPGYRNTSGCGGARWSGAIAPGQPPNGGEVLRLLATRLSRREIDTRLYVSLDTVKTHQRAVYRKFPVEHRAGRSTGARTRPAVNPTRIRAL